MKTVLIVYAISWLILLGAYFSNRSSKKGKSSFDEKEPWYLYATMIVLAPLAAILTPYFLYEIYRDKKKEKKRTAEREAKERIEKERIAGANAAFLSASLSDADYAAVGKRLHKLVSEKKYNAFLDCLDKVKLPNGTKLIVEECDEGTGDIGDTSTLLIKLPNGETDKNIFNYLVVEQSAMGAWQAYLLHKLWHVLPLFWHANYDARDYIFSTEDVNSISTFTEDERERNAIIALISDFDFTPEVREGNGKYYVSSCFWSNFSGLIREYIELTFDGNKVVDMFQFDSKTEYEYNCGILF